MRFAEGHEAEISEDDRAEIDRFVVCLRLVSQAKAAGCSVEEAQTAIYPDVYGLADTTAAEG